MVVIVGTNARAEEGELNEPKTKRMVAGIDFLVWFTDHADCAVK